MGTESNWAAGKIGKRTDNFFQKIALNCAFPLLLGSEPYTVYQTHGNIYRVCTLKCIEGILFNLNSFQSKVGKVNYMYVR